VTSLPLYQLAEMINGWHAGLPSAVCSDLQSRAHRIVLAPGQRIFSRGDKSDGIYRLLEGCVRLSGISSDSRETILDFYGPRVWFGEVSALDGLPRGHDVEACAPTVILHVAGADLAAALQRHPELSRALLNLMALRTRLLLTALESYSVQSLEPWLANRLLMLAATHGVPTARGPRIDLHLSQEVIAQLIGATRQRVNQICKKWTNQGLIEQEHGCIVLLDRKELERLARL